MRVPAERYTSVIKDLREADLGSRFDLFLRYFMVTASGLVLYHATGAALMLYWLGTYLSVNFIYTLGLYVTRKPVSRLWYVSLLAGNMVSSGLFLVMPLYLFTLEASHAFRVLAVAGMAGHALFNLSRHTKRTPLLYWDILCILGYCAFASIYQIVQYDTFPEQIVVAFGGFAVGAYYATAQLGAVTASERLREARLAAIQDQKVRAIGRLAGGVAHDFNNLLTVIKGNLELYSEVKTDAERGEVIEEAHMAANRAGEVIAQLLSFSRQSRLSPVKLELRSWAQEFEALVFRLLPETIEVKLIISSEVDAIYVDAGQLSAAMMNLVINGRDAMEGKTGRLIIRIESLSGRLRTVAGPLPDKTYVCLSVTDTGTGVHPDALTRLTEPFYTTKPTGQGSGLGLSMARGFAEQSGGGIMIETVPGQSTRVSLYIDPDPDDAI